MKYNIDKELSNQERAAVAKFTADLKKSMPSIFAVGQVARQVYQDFVDAPVWHIADAPKGVDFTEPGPQIHSVGHAKVNYVDHIETRQDDQ